MVEKDKVIKGMKCHMDGLCQQGEEFCPYWEYDDNCSKRLISDAIELIEGKKCKEDDEG